MTSATACAVYWMSEAMETEARPTLERLFKDHAAFAWRTLRRFGVPESETDDALQEVFLVVMRRLPEWRGDAAPATWVYSIARRVASSWRRDARVRQQRLEQEARQPVVPENQEELLARRQRWQTLERLLQDLDEAKREVFVLHEIDELPMTVIAESLGCPLQTAYSRLHAARRQVAEAWTRLAAAEVER